MSILTTKIQGTDTISGSRLTINNNFTLLETTINELLGYLDTSSKTLSGISSLNVISGNSGTPAPLVNTIITNGSLKVDGNFNLGGTLSGKSITLDNGTGVIINKGDLQVLNTSSITDLRGALSLSGETVVKSFSTVFQAWKKSSYISGGNNYETIVGQPDNIKGLVSLKSKTGHIIDFSGYTSSNTDLNVNRIKLTTTNVSVGHICTLIFITDNTNDFFLEIDNIADLSATQDSVGIKFNRSYQSITLVYSGSVWIPINMQNCSYVTIIP